VCYAQLLVAHELVWGVGLGATSSAAGVQAALSALHRSGAWAGNGEPVSHLAGPLEGVR
jgi:2-isopropylmalate synthase